MGGPPEPSTDRGLPIQWWHVVAAGTAVWALFAATADLEATMGRHLAEALTLLALLAWPAIPLAAYLDLRAIRADVAWEPATKSWIFVSLVPLANVPAGVAYCVRRNCAVRSELPSPRWRFGVYAGVLGWVAFVAADVAVEYVPLGALEPILFDHLLFLVWPGFSVALYLDAVRMRAYAEGSPNLRALVVLSAVPLVNVLVGALYLGSRWWEHRKLDPDAEPTLPGEEGAEPARSGRPEPLSPWYRRAVGVFVVYVLAVVALGSWLPLESDLAWDVLALALWPPFGLAFVACVHFDVRAVREAGVSWGWTRYLYYSTAAFSGPAFWYLLSRHTKVHRARSDGLLRDDEETQVDEDDAADGGDEPPGSSEPKGAQDPGASDVPTDPAAVNARTAGDGSGFEWAGDPDR